MRKSGEQDERDLPAPDPARPPGALPSFAEIKHLPREERHVALDAWVVWANASRGLMDPELERQLDELLSELDTKEVLSSDYRESD